MDYVKTAAIGLFHRDASADQVSKSFKHHFFFFFFFRKMLSRSELGLCQADTACGQVVQR